MSNYYFFSTTEHPTAGIEGLAGSIVILAIEDYKDFKLGVEQNNKHNLAELEDFFLNGWCDALLTIVGINDSFSGSSILNEINNQISEGKVTKRRNSLFGTAAGRE